MHRIDCRKYRRVFQWHEDDRGTETIMVDDAETVTQQRGYWQIVQSDWLVFPDKVDRRKTARPVLQSWKTGTRFG